MTAFGVQPTGFVIKPVTQIQTEINSDILAIIAANIDVSPDQPVGQLVGIMAEKVGEVWELAQVAYNATNRAGAEGALLENIGSLVGTNRAPPSHSTVYCTVSFSVAGTYTANSLVAYLAAPAPASVQFENVNDVTAPSLVGGNPIGVSNPYVVSILFQSTNTGPSFGNALIAANAAAHVSTGQLNQRVPVSGWLSVVDVDGPSLGISQEVDADYRVRQFTELSAPGACTLDAIQADILRALASAPQPVVGPTVVMSENTTFTVDANGLPPKSFHAVVFDGITPNTIQNDPIIGLAIWTNKPAGIQSFGAVSVTVKDSDGNPHIVQFSRAVEKFIFVIVHVACPANTDPTAAIILALVNASQGLAFTLYGTTIVPSGGANTTLLPGKDVIAESFKAIVQGQVGVTDTTAFTLGFAVNPTGTSNLPITPDQVAVIDSSHISVVVTTFVP